MPIEPNESRTPVKRMMSAEEREAIRQVHSPLYTSDMVEQLLDSHDACELELADEHARECAQGATAQRRMAAQTRTTPVRTAPTASCGLRRPQIRG